MDNLLPTLKNLPYTTVKTTKTIGDKKQKIEYINLPCGFDIETTSTMQQDTKIAYMYIWALGVGHNTPVVTGRTWEGVVEAMDVLTAYYELNEEKRLVIYVHNLGYEFQFMREYFTWSNVFSIDERKPIRALTTGGIEFRCSYILSGFSLENTARNLVKHTVSKAVGDLDYSLIRNPSTPLSKAELGYVHSDIHVVTAYIDEQLEIYGDMNKIPMTNTGRVRSYVRNECYYSSKNHRKTSKSKYIKYRKIMGDLTLTPEIYIQLKRGFMGGFTHANAKYSGMTLNEVTSIDFTSSYPAVMVSEKYPMSRFHPVEVKSLDYFAELRTKYALIFDIEFTNLEPKIEQEVYISESKCSSLVNPTINNGRITRADTLSTTLTEIDLDIMEQVYTWDSIRLANVHYAHKNYLPKAIIKSILDLYQDKTELKDVVGSEVEYMLSKGMLNSIYGMSVTDIVKDNAIYDGDWGIEKVSIEQEVEKYNESKNRFLYYPWGLWVTAYARRNLWTGIVAAGDNYVYSDTDALKVLNYETLKPYVKWFDSQIIDKMNIMCDYYGFDKKLLHPKTNEGVTKTLGIWDYEGTYPRFKTLGAKRYLVQDKRGLHITVAGLSKQNGISYLLELAGGDFETVFNLFTDDLYIPSDRTGKMTHTYIDSPYKVKIADYLGNSDTIEVLTGVHLEPCDFTLTIANQYKLFLNQLSLGYIFKGVTNA